MEGTRHDRDHKRAQLASHLADHRSGAGPRPAPHPGGDEHQVRALQHVTDVLGVLGDRLAPHARTGARAEALGKTLPDLDGVGRPGDGERLGVGVGRDELDTLQLLVDHPVDGVAARAANADDAHHSAVPRDVVELEDHFALSLHGCFSSHPCTPSSGRVRQ